MRKLCLCCLTIIFTLIIAGVAGAQNINSKGAPAKDPCAEKTVGVGGTVYSCHLAAVQTPGPGNQICPNGYAIRVNGEVDPRFCCCDQKKTTAPSACANVSVQSKSSIYASCQAAGAAGCSKEQTTVQSGSSSCCCNNYVPLADAVAASSEAAR